MLAANTEASRIELLEVPAAAHPERDIHPMPSICQVKARSQSHSGDLPSRFHSLSFQGRNIDLYGETVCQLVLLSRDPHGTAIHESIEQITRLTPERTYLRALHAPCARELIYKELRVGVECDRNSPVMIIVEPT